MTTSATSGPITAGLRARIDAALGPRGRLGVQLYASLAGEPLCDITAGEYRPGRALVRDDPLPWLCSTKLTTVMLFAQQYDLGTLTPSMPVATVVPEFAANGKQDVTFEHLLTHTAVYRHDDDDQPWTYDRAAALRAISAWPLAGPPGVQASYSVFASWMVLSEALQRITGRTYADLLRTDLLDRLDMRRTGFTTTPAATVLRERAGDGGLNPLSGLIDERSPGTGLWGPAHELARPMECVTAGGVWRGDRLLSEHAVAHFFDPCREGLYDDYFSGLDLTWSRGACADPAWFGAPPDVRVAGHTGHMTSLVVGDLDRRLVIAYASNTAVPGEPMFRRLDNLLVRDLFEAVRGR